MAQVRMDLLPFGMDIMLAEFIHADAVEARLVVAGKKALFAHFGSIGERKYGISAALIVAIVPVCILIAIFQERVVGGLTSGGMKG